MWCLSPPTFWRPADRLTILQAFAVLVHPSFPLLLSKFMEKEAPEEKEIYVNSWAQSYWSGLGSWVLRQAGTSALPLDSNQKGTRRWLWPAGFCKRKEKQDGGSCAREFLTSPSTALTTRSSNTALFILIYLFGCLRSWLWHAGSLILVAAWRNL